MHTLLPRRNFAQSAADFDLHTLGRQRVEALQVMQQLAGVRVIDSMVVASNRPDDIYLDEQDNVISEEMARDRAYFGVNMVEDLDVVQLAPEDWRFERILDLSWANYVGVRMWRGYAWALLQYQGALGDEWCARGYKDAYLDKARAIFRVGKVDSLPHRMPPWLGDRELHRSHQSQLIARDPSYYRPLYPNTPDNLPYIWPV